MRLEAFGIAPVTRTDPNSVTDRKVTMDPKGIAEGLSFWREPVAAEPLGGGLTNANFLVRHRGERFVVRVGDDIPRHQVMRFNERAASLAAHAAGLSPQVVHHEPGALVVAFVDGEVLTPETIREERRLERIVALIRICHTKMIEHLRGPLLMFWPFHILRDYAATLREGESRFVPKLSRLMTAAAQAREPHRADRGRILPQRSPRREFDR